MNASNFQEYLRRPSMLFQLDLSELRLLIEEYPYCQNLHYLLAKKGELEKLPEFKKYLSNAAVYSPDRTFLFSKIKKQRLGRTKAEGELLEFDPLLTPLPEEDLPVSEREADFETSKPMISFEEEKSSETLVGENLEMDGAATESEEELVVLTEEEEVVESVTDNELESGDSHAQHENKQEETTEIVMEEDNKLKRLSVLEQMMSQGPEKQEDELLDEEDITDEVIIKQPRRIVRVEKGIKMEELKKETPKAKMTPEKEPNKVDLEKPVVPEDPISEEIVEEHNVLNDLVSREHIVVEKNEDRQIRLEFVDIDMEPMDAEFVSNQPVPEQKECKDEENGPRINLIVNQDTIEDVKKKKNKAKANKTVKKSKKALKAKEEKLQKQKARKEEKKKKKKQDLKDFAEKSVLKYDDIASETLAKLLAKQGSTKAAVEIYERLCILNADKTNAYKKIIRKLKKK